MSSCEHIFEFPEQLCYVQCTFCDTILLVSVPCSSMLKMVTVRCGHCNNLLSVNMKLRASFLPLHLISSLTNQVPTLSLSLSQASQELRIDTPINTSSPKKDEITPPKHVNKPPEKRHRAPSAYNRFIKEEIQRLKAREPTITHKEAFSAAAKNWAHFPRIPFNVEADGCTQEEGNGDEV
ncbi:axial regulator YABBY 5 isoform X2 [Amborella trichopoda]|nr:axial regulator YABBY 5 isoform X2 [Amborella trichopoda]|eukprot:XP_020520681.1 axial regulator YABBY 5 isoform X2 [Amborella trichopoda]